MPFVYVLEPSKFDVSQLHDHGHLKHVYDVHDRRPSIWSDEFVPTTLTRLETLGFNNKEDLVAIVGHLVPLVMITNALTHKYKSVRVLYFCSTSREYVERTLGDDV